MSLTVLNAGPQDVSHLLITGGQFTNIQGNYNYNVFHSNGVHILSQNIALDAMFNSARRFPPAKCHPGTRERALKTIKDWILDPSPNHSVLWLYGPAGSGKSAIAQSIAELLWELFRAQYAGSFFFKAGDQMGRGDGSMLFSTLAYQLAVQFPTLRALIDNAMTNDPTLPAKSMDNQIKSLIVDPIMQTNGWPTHTPTVIIDGLDECTDSTIQKNIIYLISHSLRYHRLPLRFLIASRPEYWIRDAFEIGSIEPLTLRISLNDVGDANNDIKVYLMAEFDEIYKKFSRVMAYIKQPWPPSWIINRFVEDASGQFIYASTIIKFVGHSSDFCDPRERLQMLTTSGPHQAAAFSNLDSLYASILSCVPDNLQATMSMFLAGAILAIPVQAIEIFLGVYPEEVALIVDALSSVIEVIENKFESVKALEALYGQRGFSDTRLVNFHHLSFRQFLQDKSRSGKFFVDVSRTFSKFRNSIFNLLVDVLEYKPDVQQHQTYTMNIMCFQNLLDGILTIPDHYMNPDFTIFEDLKSKIHDFEPCHSPNHSYRLYILRFLNFIANCRTCAVLMQRAQQKLIPYLLNNGDMNITPLLCYIENNSLSVSEWLQLHELDIPQQIQHFLLDITWKPPAFSRTTQPIVAYLGIIPPFDTDREWLTCTTERQLAQWNIQRMELMCICLTSLGGDATNHSEDPNESGSHSYPEIHVRRSILHNFFLRETCRRSETKYLLQNGYGKQFLALLMDLKWIHTVSDKWVIDRFTLSVMGWMDELLRDPQTMSLLEEPHSTLPNRIAHTITTLYDQYFLPSCQSCRYLTELIVVNSTEFPTQCAILHIKSLPKSSSSHRYTLQAEKSDLPQGPLLPFWDILRFQERFFARSGQTLPPTGRPIIDRSSWYPHLASYLLNWEVKEQYSRLFPALKRDSLGLRSVVCAHLVDCIPYAYPNEQNLASLRALRVLSTNVRRPWHLPKGFCSAVSELLQKYENSQLSIEELDDLRDWLAKDVEINETKMKRAVKW